MDIPRMITAGLELAKELIDPDKRRKRKELSREQELEDLQGQKIQLIEAQKASPCDPDLARRLGAVVCRIIQLRDKGGKAGAGG